MVRKKHVLRPVTHRIYAEMFRLLEKNKEGMRWSELLRALKAKDRSFHPKTVNGCVWKLVEKYPDKVYKPAKGVFQLKKYARRKTQKTRS